MKLYKKNFILNVKEFSKLSYFCKKGNYVIHNSGYKHQVIEEKNSERNTLPRLLSMGMGQMSYKDFYFSEEKLIIKKMEKDFWGDPLVSK